MNSDSRSSKFISFFWFASARFCFLCIVFEDLVYLLAAAALMPHPAFILVLVAFYGDASTIMFASVFILFFWLSCSFSVLTRCSFLSLLILRPNDLVLGYWNRDSLQML